MTLEEFVELRREVGAEVKATPLHDAYVAAVGDAEGPALGRRKFGEYLRWAGFTSEAKMDGIYWLGLRLEDHPAEPQHVWMARMEAGQDADRDAEAAEWAEHRASYQTGGTPGVVGVWSCGATDSGAAWSGQKVHNALDRPDRHVCDQWMSYAARRHEWDAAAGWERYPVPAPMILVDDAGGQRWTVRGPSAVWRQWAAGYTVWLRAQR